jgi:hypothetical protein
MLNGIGNDVTQGIISPNAFLSEKRLGKDNLVVKGHPSGR